MEAKKQGFHDNLFLELETYAANGSLDRAILQEMSAANVFFVMKSGEIVTPSLDRGTILPGVTRDSVITIIEEFKDELQAAMLASTGQENISVSSRDVTVGELNDASEGKNVHINQVLRGVLSSDCSRCTNSRSIKHFAREQPPRSFRLHV